MSELWAQRPDENSKQYQAFWDYCMMGVARSLRDLVARYSQQHADLSYTEKPPTTRFETLGAWSTRYEWQKRVQAYDSYLIQQEREELEQTRQRWIKRELLDAQKQLDRWDEAWQTTQYHEQEVTQSIPDPNNPGQMMRVVVVRSNVAKMQGLSRWRREISDQARRALGLPDKITENKTEHSGTIHTVKSWREIVEEEREEAFARMQAMQENNGNGYQNGHGSSDADENEENLPVW